MAKVPMNALTRHLQGKVGDIVFRTVNGRVIAALRPKARTTPPGPAQLATQLRFRKAIDYAKRSLANPSVAPAYEQIAFNTGNSSFAAAVRDFFVAPTIDEIDVSSYRGRVGETIRVIASEDAGVMSVHVTVRNGSIIVEEGEAIVSFDKWFYTTTTLIPAGQPITIEAIATDRPGNTGSLQKGHVTS